MGQVDRVKSLSKFEFYERYLIPRRPVVFTELTSSWPAMQSWSWDYWATQYGEVMVPIDKNAALARDRNFTPEDRLAIGVRGFIAYLNNPQKYAIEGGPLYAKWHYEPDLPALREAYHPPDLFEDWTTGHPPQVDPMYRWIYMGPAGSGSGLHIDTVGTHAWLAQVLGRKEWRLYAPEQVPIEYCDVADAFSPELERFPAFATAELFETVLAPGELIFIPAGWRHQVRNLDATLAITENFANVSNFVEHWRGIPQSDLLLRLSTMEIARVRAKAFMAEREPGASKGDAVSRYEHERTVAMLAALAHDYQEEAAQTRALLEHLSERG